MSEVPHGPEIPYLSEFIVFLVTAVVVVPVSRMLRISPILGFLLVGAIVGPSGFKLVTDVEGINALAELGVIFLLFTIGLELSLERLWQMRRYVFGLGTTQVLVCGLAIGGIAYFWGNSVEASVLLGLSLALSSTAIVTQLLVEKGQFSSQHGRVSFSILLFQDLAVVPLLFLVGVLAQDGGSPLLDFGMALLKALAAIAAILILGRVLLRPIFRVIAGTRSPEVFVALTLLAILGTAFVTGEAGLSMALGAFLAGLLIAETEYRHQVEADIEPFKGLLLGLFFISVGLRLDLGAVSDKIGLVVASVFGLYALKIVLIIGVAMAAKVPRDVAIRSGFMLGQGGEFAFVIVTAAMAAQIMPGDVGQFMLLVAGVTMAMTPFMPSVGDWVCKKLSHEETVSDVGAPIEEADDLEGHIIIAGFGRVGHTVARLLSAQKVPYVALDLSPQNLARYRKNKQPVFFGDARQKDVMEMVGAERAEALVITLDNPAAVRQTLHNARQHWPHLKVYVRASDSNDAHDLMQAGAHHAVPETVESSLRLAAEVLEATGTPPEAVRPLVEEHRWETYERLRRPHMEPDED